MRIIIIGAGNAGRHLAERLRGEQHDIVLIDENPDVLEEVKEQIDALLIRGNGASPVILEEADVRKADLLVAATNNDETNILAALLAHKAGVSRTVARVASRDYLSPPEGLDFRAIGIDLLVSQQEECAREIFNILRMPGVMESADVFGEKLLVVGLQVHMDSPLTRYKVREFPPEQISSIRIIATARGKETFVPKGDTIFVVGDIVYLAGRQENVARFMDWAWPEHARFGKVIIAGGGDLGIRVAQLVEEKTDIPVALIEHRAERAEFCSEKLHRTMVLRGNALDENILQNAGVSQGTAFVAAMHDDEKNLFACLLASKLGASYTIVQISNPDYVPIIRRLGLVERIVSPPLSMNNAILHFVRGGYVQEAAAFQNIRGELLDFVIAAKSPWAGKTIKSLRIPEGVILVGVQRNEDILIPTGDMKLSAGDRLVVFALPENLPKLEKILNR